jgi:hypothetical protein
MITIKDNMIILNLYKSVVDLHEIIVRTPTSLKIMLCAFGV